MPEKESTIFESNSGTVKAFIGNRLTGSLDSLSEPKKVLRICWRENNNDELSGPLR